MKIVVLFVAHCIAYGCHAQHVFQSFDQFAAFAESKSVALKNGALRYSEADRKKLLAIYELLEPSGGLSGTFNNNTQLAVTPIPDASGSDFNFVPFGTQYQTTLNAYAELKILNLAGIQNLRLAKLNLESVELTNKLTHKTLLENLATAYYNVVYAQQKVKLGEQLVAAADSLLQLTQQKFNAGIVSSQQVNKAMSNWLTQQNELEVTTAAVKLQYVALKLVADLPAETELVIEHQQDTSADTVELTANTLQEQLYHKRFQYAQADANKKSWSMAPTLSLFASTSRQQFNTSFTIADVTGHWVPSSYIGFRMTFTIPSANTLTARTTALYSERVEENNWQQSQQQTILQQQQLQWQREQASNSVTQYERIYALDRDSYAKDEVNYRAGIVAVDTVLDSFKAMCTSAYQLATARAQQQLTEVKIEINHEVH